MASENVVPIEDIAGVVERTILEIQRGVANARINGGIIVDMPKEIVFSMVVVGEWQSARLQLSSDTRSESLETQGGGTVETSNGTESQTQTTDRSETRDDTSERNVTSQDKTADLQTTTSNDQRTTKDDVSGNTANDRRTAGSSTSRTTYNQKQDNTVTSEDN